MFVQKFVLPVPHETPIEGTSHQNQQDSKSRAAHPEALDKYLQLTLALPGALDFRFFSTSIGTLVTATILYINGKCNVLN